MPLSYNKLWKKMIDEKISQKELQEKTNISRSTFAKMKKGLSINTLIIEKICSVLNCNVSDIMDYVKEENK